MQKSIERFFREATSTNMLAPIAHQWPKAIVVLGVAITPVWAGVLAWFLFHLIASQLSH